MEHINQHRRPHEVLNEERSFMKYVLLSIVTLGIYSIFFYASVGRDINTIATKYDLKRTMNYYAIAVPLVALSFLLAVIGVLTVPTDSELMNMSSQDAFSFQVWMVVMLGFIIAVLVFVVCSFVWLYRVNKRIGNMLKFRQLDYEFGVKDFWLWYMFVPILFSIPAEFVSGLPSFMLYALSFVGPGVYAFKLIKSMNMLSQDHNMNFQAYEQSARFA